jgi:hypothetical protein
MSWGARFDAPFLPVTSKNRRVGVHHDLSGPRGILLSRLSLRSKPPENSSLTVRESVLRIHRSLLICYQDVSSVTIMSIGGTMFLVLLVGPACFSLLEGIIAALPRDSTELYPLSLWLILWFPAVKVCWMCGCGDLRSLWFQGFVCPQSDQIHTTHEIYSSLECYCFRWQS